MSEYPPQNPPGEVAVPVPPSINDLAYTGVDDVFFLLMIASVLIFLGVWAIVYVGRKSDSHHEDK